MPIIDPNAKAPASDGLPPNEYLLAIKSLEARTSRAGNRYLNARVVVIAGPAKKRSFFQGITLHTDGGQRFLQVLAKSMGVSEPFDTDDDRQCIKALCGRPFKATVERRTENGYTNNSIGRVCFADKLTERDRAAMDLWVAEAAEDGQWSGGGDDVPPPGDDDYGYGGGAGPSTGRDDDLPF